MTSGRLVTAVMAAVTVALVVVPAVDAELAQGNSTALGATRSDAISVPGGSVATVSSETPAQTAEAAELTPEASANADEPTEAAVSTEPAAPTAAPTGRSSAAASGRPASGRKIVHLTFDDGPDESTPQVLDILARHGVRATFFVIGEHAAEHPDLVKRIRAEGHTIGNHTWTHPWLTKLSPAGVRSELSRTEQVIGGSTCMRSPGGLENDAVKREAAALGLTPVGWTADSRDWQQPGVQAITRNIMDNVSPGGTILMHDGGGDRTQTVAALDGVLATLETQGYSFEPLPACQ